MKPGVYVHIPFCEQRCYYCAFTVALSPERTYEPYVRRVIREIELSGFHETPETIFFGGGTPSIIGAELLVDIVRRFPQGATEITIEANPGTLDTIKLKAYKQADVGRISLGAQSFCDEDLQNAGRLHRAADVFRDIELIRQHGFTNLNLDLIAGLPNQRLEVWMENLDCLEKARPEHVSIYMLDFEERSLWGKNPIAVPEDEQYVDFYREASNRLQRAGYIHYEISNWALPGFECRHNLKYWTGVPYRGFGVSAHSLSNKRRFWNTTSLNEYAEMIDSGKIPIAGQEELTTEMQLEEAFLLGLRRIAGFDIWRVAQDLGIRYPSGWFDRVGDLEDAGWIQFDGTTLRLTSAGWLLANSLTEELLWPNLLSISEATP